MLRNPAGVDSKAVGANAPKAAAVDPASNLKTVADKGGGLAGGAARRQACVNSDGAPVPNENAVPREVDGAV